MTTQAIEFLKKTLQQKETIGSGNDKNLVVLKGLPFYCEWSPTDKYLSDTKSVDQIFVQRHCCFNHAIGLPKRLGQEKPLFYYERTLFDTLQNHKMVYLLKATGIGATEFMIRYISWLCTKDDQLKGSQIVIATGPRLETSVSIVERMKYLFIDSNLATFNTRATVIDLNGVHITAIPSDHLDDARGIPNVSFFYSDETAFYSNKEQDNLIDVSQRYILKSNPWIVFVSTPNKDGDIMHKISLEKDSLWTKLYFDYRVAVGHMWTLEEVEQMKKSSAFEKEYNLKFGYGTSTVFNVHDIDFITSDPYDTSDETCTSPYFTKWLAIDPGWGGSNSFGICIVQWKDSKLELVYEAELQAPLMEDVHKLIHQLIIKYHICRCYIDQSSAVLIRQLCKDYGETIRYDLIDEKTREQLLLGTECRRPLINMVNFRTWHKRLAERLHQVVSTHQIRIDQTKFPLATMSLRTAINKPGDIWDIDKLQTSHSDVFDALRMCTLCLRSGN